jgi:hypothetical protein
MEEERDDLDNCMLELVVLMLEDRQGVRRDKFWEMEITERGTPAEREDQRSKNCGTRRSTIEELKTLHEEDGPVNSVLMSRKVEVGPRFKSTAEAFAYRTEGKSLGVLQVNCRSVYNKALEFWNLVDAYNPDVVIGMESWLKEDISSAEVFRADFTTFIRDRSTRGGYYRG